MVDVTCARAGVIPERVVLFGSERGFTRPLLAQLLGHGVSVTAVVLPGVDAPRAGERFPVDVQTPGDTFGLALEYGIPVIRIPDCGGPQLPGVLAAQDVDVLLVACFPWKLPCAVRELPRLACWNLHPSLLPAYRGPAPLYWQLHNNEQRTGVTLHEVSECMDAGNIVALQAQPLPVITGVAVLNDWVAGIGVKLFLEALVCLREGRLESTPQDESVASYYPWPVTVDG